MLIFRKRSEGGTQQIEENVKRSFAGVRQDIQTAWQWIQYLQTENAELRHSLDGNTAALQQLPTTEIIREEIQTAVQSVDVSAEVLDRLRHMEHRVDRLAKLDQKVEVIAEHQNDVFSRLRALHSQVQDIGNYRRQDVIPRTVPARTIGNTQLQEKAAKIAARNSKEMIKNSILKLIRLHGKISGIALRESIVSEQGLCSKSSFYRLLEEMEDTDDITVVQDGKEKTYFWGSPDIKKQI